MVTFRFYVVSTVAFFLALAVGVLVGSVLDGRIADGLQDRLDGVEASLDETVAAMDAKNVQIDELERYIEASAPFAVQGELDGHLDPGRRRVRRRRCRVCRTWCDGSASPDRWSRGSSGWSPAGTWPRPRT